jgi:hypothetical protein
VTADPGERALADQTWAIAEPGATAPREERRVGVRQRVCLEAQLAIAELLVPGIIRDATNHGLFVETSVLVAPGQDVALVHPSLALASAYRVVHHGRVGGRRGLGLVVVAREAAAATPLS